MQVEFKEINATSKEIDLTVETERVEAAYLKYLVKAAKGLEVPGFRKGKAPLGMVEKLHSERIKDYFEKDFVDEVFTEAAREHDIHFLLYPEVKEINWERGSEMKIKFEIEHEPTVNITQTENLEVPYRPILLEDEVQRFIVDLTKEHTTIMDVDAAESNDQVHVDLSIEHDGHSHQFQVTMYAGDEFPQRSLAELIGAKTGDKVNANLSGKQIKLLTRESSLHLENEETYPCVLEVSHIERFVVPAIDDEFAKDMEFADEAEMRSKIADDLRLKVEHRNIEGEHGAILAKLFMDNKFPLPPKTTRYILDEEVQKVDPKLREIMFQYFMQQIMQEMTGVYILKSLRGKIKIEVTEEMTEQYIEHRAILEDKTAFAWREENKERIADEDFSEAVANYMILRQIAASSRFVEPPAEEPAEESTEANGEEA